MKKTKVVMSAGLVLAAVFALTLLGCPHETEEDTIDSRLVASWTNGKEGGLKKEFTIEGNGTFKASINPVFLTPYNTAYGAAKKGGADDAAAAQAGATAIAVIPEGTDAATRWTVTGELVKDEGDFYIMKNLHETSKKPANPAAPDAGSADGIVGGYNSEKVQIVFDSDGRSFTFTGVGDEAEKVTAFFGGAYTKKE